MNSKDASVGTMPAHRKISLAAGLLYLLTFVSIPTLALYTKAKETGYILGTGPDISPMIGGILEIVVALAGIATAVVLFSILKKQSEIAAVGLVASRVLEAGCIFVGVGFILTIVMLRKDGSGVDALAISHTLALLYDRVFLISQSFLPGVNDLLLGFLLYQSRLVPRFLSMVGTVGGILVILGFLAVMGGIVEQGTPLPALSALGVFLFELSLGMWLVFKGFDQAMVAKLDKKH